MPIQFQFDNTNQLINQYFKLYHPICHQLLNNYLEIVHIDLELQLKTTDAQKSNYQLLQNGYLETLKRCEQYLNAPSLIKWHNYVNTDFHHIVFVNLSHNLYLNPNLDHFEQSQILNNEYQNINWKTFNQTKLHQTVPQPLLGYLQLGFNAEQFLIQLAKH